MVFWPTIMACAAAIAAWSGWWCKRQVFYALCNNPLMILVPVTDSHYALTCWLHCQGNQVSGPSPRVALCNS